MLKTTLWSGIQLSWAYRELLLYIRHKVHCPHTAYDILHDALIRYTVSTSEHKATAPHAYLRTIAKNLIIDNFHQQQRFHPAELTEEHLQVFSPQAPSPDALTEIKQRLEMIQQILECLPPRCREVFWLYRVEGHTQLEIAQLLNISKNMVERHVMRAIVDLSFAREYLIGAL